MSTPNTTLRCCGFTPNCNKKDSGCKFAHPAVCSFSLTGKCFKGTKCKLPHPEIKDNTFTFDGIVYTLFVPKPAKVSEVKADESAPKAVQRPNPRPKPFTRGPKKTLSEADVNAAAMQAMIEKNGKPLASCDKKLSKEIEELAKEQVELTKRQADVIRRLTAAELLLKTVKTASAMISDYESLLANTNDTSDTNSEQSEEISEVAPEVASEVAPASTGSWADSQ
jgi:hypothetical protein